MSELLDKIRVYLAQAAEIDQISDRLQDMENQHLTLEQEIDQLLAEEDSP